MIEIFVFDTNVIISAHLLFASESRKAYNLALQRGILAYSKSTFEEYQSVFLRNKFDKYISVKSRIEALRLISEKGIFFDVSSDFQICRDPKDNIYLNLAIDAKASCIVTGDADLLVLNHFKGIPILSPRRFLEKYEETA